MKNEYTIREFAGAIKNPHVGKFIKNGKYPVVVEHDGFNELIEVDTKTGQKIMIQKIMTKQVAL